MLPNLDIVATGVLSPADQLVLSAYAEHTGDRVWTISAASLLGGIDAGRDLAEFTAFLTRRREHELPDTMTTLLTDSTRRVGQLTDLGHARVIETGTARGGCWLCFGVAAGADKAARPTASTVSVTGTRPELAGHDRLGDYGGQGPHGAYRLRRRAAAVRAGRS